MQIVLLIVRLILALVFGVAGIAKAADPAGSRRAMVGFGIPERLASPLGFGLPFAEIVIAVILIPVSSAWVGAIAALAVLLMFSAGIAVNLARGKAPDCHCFGQLYSEPVGWSTLTRNLILMSSAGFVVVQGNGNSGASALSWLEGVHTVEIVTPILSTVAVALLVIAVVYLRRMLSQQAILMTRVEAIKKVIDEDYAEAPVERAEAVGPTEGLPIGAPAPDFALPSLNGAQVSLDNLLAYGKSVLVLFVSPNCAPCESLFPLVGAWERDYAKQLTIALVSKGSARESEKLSEEYNATHVLLQKDAEVASDYRGKWTPAAVLIGPNGKIASEIAFGDEAIKVLVKEAGAPDSSSAIAGNGAGRNANRLRITESSSLRIGDPAPDFSITDFENRVFNNWDFNGEDTALLFWDPACPFCRQMSESLVQWEENPPKNSPRLVFVASGDAEKLETDSTRFTSLYLHDAEFKLAPQFGTSSTPSAVLIDADGRIASTIAMGLPNAMALLGVRNVALPVVSVS